MQKIVMVNMMLVAFAILSFRPHCISNQVVVTTIVVKNMTSSGAVCEYTVMRTGTRFEHGVCVSRDPNPTYSKTSLVYKGVEVKSLSEKIYCNATISSLKSKVKYYVRAYQKQTDGSLVYGNQLSFTTL